MGLQAPKICRPYIQEIAHAVPDTVACAKKDRRYLQDNCDFILSDFGVAPSEWKKPEELQGSKDFMKTSACTSTDRHRGTLRF